MIVGVLALQGAFAKHLQAIRALGVEAKEVRMPKDLERCDALIIPGGESTVIGQILEKAGLREPLLQFAREKPVFGTCAGLILMSQTIIADSLFPFGLLDISVERNAYGRQIESFASEISFNAPHSKSISVPALFIRAPRIRRVGPAVQVIGTYGQEPVLVLQGHCLGATFHPELTENLSIHRYFLSLIVTPNKN